MTDTQGAGVLLFLAVITGLLLGNTIRLQSPPSLKATRLEQQKYKLVSEVVNPRQKTHIGTIFKTEDSDTGATIYVLFVGDAVQGLAVLREPQKE